MRYVLVTGANGFIGSRLCSVLANKGYSVSRAFRTKPVNPAENNNTVVGEINANTHWRAALEGVDIVIHLAARVHVVKDTVNNPEFAFNEVNVLGTKQLARTASDMGIKHFIYLSSIKVNGEFTPFNSPFTEDSIPNPQDPYGTSKWKAEQTLLEIQAKTDMGVTIIRPCLVYGPGVKANFLTMMKWVNRALPLPLGMTHNLRSLIYLDNLVDLIITSINNKSSIGETFLASDGEDLSTSELLARLAKFMEKPSWLLPVPESILRPPFELFGRKYITDRLFGSLVVDSSKARNILNWSPPYSVDDGLQQTALWYLSRNGE